MEVKRARINDTLYNVVSPETYVNTPELYPNYRTAIEAGDYVLPLINKTDEKTGTVYNGMVFEIREQNRGDLDGYNKSNLTIYDLGNSTDTTDLITKQKRIAEINKEIMETVDNIYIPCRNEDDVPEMVIFKDALEAKHMDIDKYIPAIENATGSKFGNDKRLLNKSEITIKKLKGFADGLDMKLTLIIEDKDPNVPNPIGTKLSAVINNGSGGY